MPLSEGLGDTTAPPPQAAIIAEVTRRVIATQRQLRFCDAALLVPTQGQLQPLVVPQVMHL